MSRGPLLGRRRAVDGWLCRRVHGVHGPAAGVPRGWLEQILAYSSTNVQRLSSQPVRTILSSAFWVADEGHGYFLYLGAFVLVVARAEQRLGSRRLLTIAFGTHVLASLVMVAAEAVAIGTSLAPASLASTTDVGVSYVLVGGSVAAAATLPPRSRTVALAALTVAVGVPLLLDRGLWDAGHVVALACAVGLTRTVLRFAPLTVPGPSARWLGPPAPAAVAPAPRAGAGL